MSDKYELISAKIVGLGNWHSGISTKITEILRSYFPPDDGAEGWIKVSKRLPDGPGQYIAYPMTGEITTAYVGAATFNREDGLFWLDDSGYECEVTHWRELPDPPKEQP